MRLYGLPRPGAQAPNSATLRTGARLRSPEVLRSQLLWLSALGRETALLVPEPVPTRDGSLLGRVSTDDISCRQQSQLSRWRSRRGEDQDLAEGPRMPRNFVLLRWVPGEHKRGRDLKPDNVSLVGSYVARLHRHAEGYEVAEEAILPRWDWEWPFGEGAPLWSEGKAFYSEREIAAFREASRRVREDLGRLGEGGEVFGLVHRDLTLDNLLFGKETVGAMDFDLCGLGYYLFDLHTLRAFLKTHHGDRLEPLWEAFVEAYQRERPVPEDLQRHLLTFEVMQKVAAVNRQLVLLSSGHAGARLRSPDFLASVASWLKNLSRRWGT